VGNLSLLCLPLYTLVSASPYTLTFPSSFSNQQGAMISEVMTKPGDGVSEFEDYLYSLLTFAYYCLPKKMTKTYCYFPIAPPL
jgi:hypothetical protein